MKEKLLEDFIGYKISLDKPTGTTTKYKMYEIKGVRCRKIAFIDDIIGSSAEVEIINNNGRLISILASRFNFNSFSKV